MFIKLRKIYIFHFYGTTGEANALRKYGPDLRYLCEQSYEHAGNMAGRYQDAAAARHIIFIVQLKL